MGGHNCNCATYCLRTRPLWNIFKNIFYKKVLYLVVEYILSFSPVSENFYFLENMLITHIDTWLNDHEFRVLQIVIWKLKNKIMILLHWLDAQQATISGNSDLEFRYEWNCRLAEKFKNHLIIYLANNNINRY